MTPTEARALAARLRSFIRDEWEPPRPKMKALLCEAADEIDALRSLADQVEALEKDAEDLQRIFRLVDRMREAT
jgi:hypothetical protein